MDEHACLPNAAFSYDIRPRRHMLGPGIYVQACRTNTNVLTKGHKLTVNTDRTTVKRQYLFWGRQRHVYLWNGKRGLVRRSVYCHAELGGDSTWQIPVMLEEITYLPS